MLDLFELIPRDWQEELQDLRQALSKISVAISSEPTWEARISPRPELIFTALEIPPRDVRVVIVGQDPYPNRSHATGRAFAVPNETEPLPASLKNIFREKLSDVEGDVPKPDLMNWQNQGILLLNTVLTTLEGHSASHARLGWELITGRIIEIVASSEAVGILWGRSAQRFEDRFKGRVVTGVHPSPLSAHRGFFGSKPFSRTNRFLDRPIEW